MPVRLRYALLVDMGLLIGSTALVDVIEEPVRKKRFQTEIDRTAPLPSDKAARRLEDIMENVLPIFLAAEEKTFQGLGLFPARSSYAAR